MKHASQRKIGEDAVPTKILSLNELENDIFIDIFSNSYTKILKALAKKKADSIKNTGIINLAKSRAARNSSQRDQYGSMKQGSIILSETQKGNLTAQLAFAAISGQSDGKGKKFTNMENIPKNQSALSLSSENDRESAARRTNQSGGGRNSQTGPVSRMLLGAEKRDISRMEKEAEHYLDFQDYLHYVESDPGERPEVIDDLIFHLTGAVQ